MICVIIMENGMVKQNISDQTKKMLFAKSGNLCALCKKNGKNTILVDANNTMDVNIAHIVSRNQKDVRFDPNYTKVNDEENLILLCNKCHGEIDTYHPENYSVETLRELKKQHEEYFTQKIQDISDIADVTKNNVNRAKYPQNLKYVWESLDEETYNRDIADTLKDYKNLIDNLIKLPADCRRMLQICLDRADRKYLYYKVPVAEIERVMNRDSRQIKDLFDICERYGFLNYGTEDGIGYFYIAKYNDRFEELKYFSQEKKVELSTFFNDLNFAVLDI